MERSRSLPAPQVQERQEGFTEAAFCLFYIGLHVYSVLIVVALSMALTGHKRKYTKRKSMIVDPNAPSCDCGQYKCGKTKRGFRIKCHRCRRNKAGSASGSSSDGETEAGAAGPSQQQERPSNTLRHSSGSVISPTPTVRGRRPSGSTWDGSAYVSTDPNITRERRQTARRGRGVSTLQPSRLTDFSWLRCEKDPALMAQTAGRCSTESEDEVACPGCTWCSRLYCIECRNRTGNIFSAAIGCRTFKWAECVRHAQGFHRMERGSHSVPTLLITIYAQRSTAPAVGLMSSSKYGLLLLKTAGNRPPIRLGLSDSASGYVGNKQRRQRHRDPGAGRGGRERRARGGGRERKMTRRSGSLSGQILGL